LVEHLEEKPNLKADFFPYDFLLLICKYLFSASWASERLHITQNNAVNFQVKLNLHEFHTARGAKQRIRFCTVRFIE